MTVIVINGFPQSGKTTFTDFCCERTFPYGKNLSTVDFIKQLAFSLGWDGTKDDKNRKFLSDLKKIFTEWNDLPMKKLEEAIKEHQLDLFFEDYNFEKAIIFVHCREPQEIKKIVEKYNAITLLIKRPQGVQNFFNNSDSEVENFEYDYVITNEGTLEDLRDKANSYIDELFLTKKIPYSYNSNFFISKGENLHETNDN